ncbi:hypothetical protein AGDE_08300 [Angomonas deanei]|nr:hypothetical protein AGDE_08300 [Angomonas deanei]|eukprot:EPY33404.1 hypothetical protein AGDE_08300 [Angomonas deanei]
MFRLTVLWRETGRPLYPRTSLLPIDFYHCCKNHLNIQLNYKTYVGMRSSQQRGIFLDPSEHIKQNQVIATIPLTSLHRLSNIQTKPNTMRNVSLDDVRNAIKNSEFKMMAPQIYMGLQFSSIISLLPDVSKQKSMEDIDKCNAVLQSDINPWARMLDDEDFNEDFVLSMYGMSLDNWQRNKFDDLNVHFRTAMNDVYMALQPPFKPEHFRRITRLIIARVEHVPPEDYYDGNATIRRLRRRLRQLRGKPDPTDLAMVPFLDMLNHSNRPNVGIRVGPSPVLNGKGAITVYSLCEIAPGHELCRHYNFAISRPFALFRYGFLPFDLITMTETDPAMEHVFKNQHMMSDESMEAQRAKEMVEREVDRLETLFKEARGEKPSSPPEEKK